MKTDEVYQTEAIGLRSLPKKQVIITLIGVFLAMFLSSLDQTIVGVAMPRIITDLGGFTHYTWVTTAYLIASTIMLPITGKITDMYGRKLLYIIGISIFTAGSLLCGLSQTMTQIILFRGLQGIGAGIMMANAFTVIGDLFPPAERGKYQGLVSAVFGISSVIGPTLGGYLTDSLSWHWVFFINIPLALIVIGLFIGFFPDYRPDSGKARVDYPGVILLVLTVIPAMLALSWGGVDYSWTSATIIGMFAFSAAMGILFIYVEKRSVEPVFPLSLFRNSIVALSNVVVFFTGIGMFGVIIFVPLYFQGVLGVSATTSGSFLTPMMMGVVFGGLISGQVLSRAGGHYRIQGMAGLAFMSAGMFLLSRMTEETSYTNAIVNIVITGFGLGVTMPLYMIAVQNTVPYKMLGAGTSMIAFVRSIGGTVGLAIFGSVLNNRFAGDFITRLPDSIKTVVPVEQLNSLAHNPQALVSTDAQTQLKGLFDMFGADGTAAMDQVLSALRGALSSSLSTVFIIGFGIMIVAFIFNLFIKELPLRRQHVTDDG